MRMRYNLSQLNWSLAGWIPESWRMLPDVEEVNTTVNTEVAVMPAKVPGSVQAALLDAGRIPDWNIGMNAVSCEWVEHRHWIYEAHIPDEWIKAGMHFRLMCLGLDNAGYVMLNGKPVGEFKGAHQPHEFDLTSSIRSESNTLRIIMDTPPKWLGYTGFTSRFTEWKARFSYSWDWMVRFVPIGIWDDIILNVSDRNEICDFLCISDSELSTSTGSLRIQGRIPSGMGKVEAALYDGDSLIHREEVSASQFTAVGISWNGLPVDLWWPNLEGNQKLYTIKCVLMDADGSIADEVCRRVGFRNISWQKNEGAPSDADPWICVVNGRPVFLQGVNWTPIRPNFADLTEADYRKRLEIYKDMGLNIFRVWGGGILEKEAFYNLCDELGLMVWQEFPLSSSSFENWPPEDPTAINEMRQIAKSYIKRRQHHPSLIMWCGGNELHRNVKKDDGTMIGAAADLRHPMLSMLRDVVAEYDPSRRFTPTSPFGPLLDGDPKDAGKGLHWDVHGPWMPHEDLNDWADYWAADDSLFRSEVGSPSASSTSILTKYAAPDSFVEPSADSPVWRRQFDWWWWAEWQKYVKLFDRKPADLDEYVRWSQKRQADALEIAARACKGRFPKCGGFIVWMGQDCFPCTANTSIIDFNGDPKPAVEALRKIFRG